MLQARILLFLGIWTAILSYLGFPAYIKNILFAITGFGLIYISFIIYKEKKTETTEETTYENFYENTSFSETEETKEEDNSF